MYSVGVPRNTDFSPAVSMSDVEVKVELQLENVSLGQYSLGSPQHEEMGGGGKEPDCRESLQHCGQTGQIMDPIYSLVSKFKSLKT